MSDQKHLSQEQVKDIDENIAWAKINTDVLRSMENPRKGYWVALFISVCLFCVMIYAEVYQYIVGIGV